MSPIIGVIDSAKTGNLVTGAFDYLGNQTVSSATATLVFSAIPQTYSHLRVIATTRSDYNSSTVGGSGYKLQMGNGSANTSSIYSFGQYYGRASTSVSYGWSGLVDYFYGEAPWSQAGGFGGALYNTTIYDIIDYTNTSNIKTVRQYQGFVSNTTSNNAYVAYYYGTFNSSTAINYLKFDSSTPFADGIFAVGTKIDLYGVK